MIAPDAEPIGNRNPYKRVRRAAMSAGDYKRERD